MKAKQSFTVEEEGNIEWADAMKNILSMDKPKSKNSLILSRAEKLDPKQENDEGEDEKHALKKLAAQANLKKEWLSRGRYKPNMSEEGERERKLRRIAVAGVVQLFNAVGKHQHTGNDLPMSRTAKSFKPLDKKSFLGLLLGKDELKQETSEKDEDQDSRTNVKEEEIKDELAEDSQDSAPKWDVLRNDFMMSTKLKDWDKQMEP